jgi:alpha-1,2-mannosyltransferase
MKVIDRVEPDVETPDHEATRPWWSNPRIATAAAIAAAAVAIVICVNQLRVPHAFFGLDEYDDGVDLGAAIRLAHGSIPYRDFLFGHPPGVPLLMTPFAVVGRFTGTRDLMAMVRVVTLMVTAGCVFLVANLVRKRGVHAAMLAGVLLAVFPMAVTADKTLLLEPYLVFFCLVGASLILSGDDAARTSRFVIAGAAFGFAGAIKLWAVLPAAVALACCLPSVRRKVRPMLLGMVGGFVVPALPFFLLAPSAFFHDVISIQLSRGSSVGSLSVSARLVYITGVQGLTAIRPTEGVAELVSAAVVVSVIVAFLLRPRPTRLDWFALGSAVTAVLALLIAPDFHPHYSYFSAPFLALLIAVSCDRLLRGIGAGVGALAGRVAKRRIESVLAASLVVAAVVGAIFGIEQARSFDLAEPGYVTVADPGPIIAAAVPKGACAIADEPALLITADRFVSTRACPALLDPYYLWLFYDRSHPPPIAGPYNTELVARWRALFGSVDYVVLSANPFRIPWTADLAAYFNRTYKLVATGPDVSVYRYSGAPR